ncbi:hypothetical protein DSECCO2_538460 [anaerobic digester metagenome]
MKGMRGELGEEYKIKFGDGFCSDHNEIESQYVVWNNGESYDQNVYYLHGALHLFDAGYELRKYTWSRTNEPLIEQSRKAIDQGLFPLFVSEGSSESKMNKIVHSGYLHKGLRSLVSISGVLFIHGMSFSQNDEHIIKIIERGNIKKIFIGIFGDINTPLNQAIAERANLMTHSNPDMTVNFYDSASAEVWGAS